MPIIKLLKDKILLLSFFTNITIPTIIKYIDKIGKITIEINKNPNPTKEKKSTPILDKIIATIPNITQMPNNNKGILLHHK
mgnify:CR=1 FL=1